MWGVTFAPDYVGAENEEDADSKGCLGSGDARRSDCPSLSVVSYGTFCLGGFPQPQQEVVASCTRQIRASATTAQSPATGSTEARHPVLQVWASPEWPAVGRACSLTGVRGAGGLGCAMKWPLQKEQETLFSSGSRDK